MPGFLIACGGFLTGVLWMDLLFDTRILVMAPETAVAIIAPYYENATLRAFPMNRLIGLTMVATVLGATSQLIGGRVELRLALAATALSVSAVGLALARVVPNAMQLGTRAGSIEEQAALARAICFDHMVCLALMLAFITAEIVALRRESAARSPRR